MAKYLVFGNGWLGNKFKNYLGDDAILTNKRINSVKDIYFELSEHKPEIVINCIGKTGRPNVDWCESNKEISFFSNVTVPTLLAEVCSDVKIRLVHIGSGCIYQNRITAGLDLVKYSEVDKPNFIGSFYSRTKIYSESILSWYGNVLQIRIRMPIDNKPGDRNLITKLVRYKEVIGDIPNSITYLPDLMKVSKELMDRKESGIYNVVNSGVITHKELLQMYKWYVDPTFKLPKFIGLEELEKLIVAGRSNCTLSINKLDQKGIKIRSVRDILKECFQEYKKYIKGV